jgi:hypothetical protein
MKVSQTSLVFTLLVLALPAVHGHGQNAPATLPDSPTKKLADVKSSSTKNGVKPSAAEAKPVRTDDSPLPENSNKTSPTQSTAVTKGDLAKPTSKADTDASNAGSESPQKKITKNEVEGPPCIVADFRAIGIDVQEVAKRRSQAFSWLKEHAKQCSVEQLLMLRNNRSQWMGTADSARLAAVVDSMLEAIAAENPRVATLLYGTPPPPPPPGGEDKK